MLEGIAEALGNKHKRIRALRFLAAEHREAGLRSVTGDHYAGSHWLGSFAIYLVTGRGLSVAVSAVPARPKDKSEVPGSL